LRPESAPAWRDVRGWPSDAGVFSGLRRERVEVRPVDPAGGAVIATTDIDDVGRLAHHADHVVVAPIQP